MVKVPAIMAFMTKYTYKIHLISIYIWWLITGSEEAFLLLLCNATSLNAGSGK